MKELTQRQDAEQADDSEWGNWVSVGQYPTLREANDHGLVILAMGEACRVAANADQKEFQLQAEMHPAPRIAVELDAYAAEISLPDKTVPTRKPWGRYAHSWVLCGYWMLLLVSVYYCQGIDDSLIERARSSSVGLFQRGEWWRPFTAQFLHGDMMHLIGNLLVGAAFITFVVRAIGPFKGWGLTLLCGTLGNALTSWSYYPDHFSSIGASTSVFAALGILSGLGIAESLPSRPHLPWLRILTPFMAGVVLLGMLGASQDPHTDVLGHICGFGFGLPAGIVAGIKEEKKSAHAILEEEI
jgi:membrane associated rhomboid family serine protease